MDGTQACTGLVLFASLFAGKALPLAAGSSSARPHAPHARAAGGGPIGAHIPPAITELVELREGQQLWERRRWG